MRGAGTGGKSFRGINGGWGKTEQEKMFLRNKRRRLYRMKRGQQELTASYIDGIYKLADEDDSAKNESV